MGQPVAHGFPDWGRQASPTDVALVDAIGQVINAQTTLFSGYVGNTNYLNLKISASAGTRIQVTFTFWTSALMNHFVGETQLVAAQGLIILTGVPVAGPYVTIEVTAAAFPATISTAIVTGVVPHSRVSIVSLEPRLIHQTINVGAGATANFDAGVGLPGLAVLSIHTSLATWFADIQSLSVAGVAFPQNNVNSTTYPGPFLIALHGGIPRIAVTNSTGAAGNVTVGLVAVAKGFG